ncbi:Fic family protein [Streptomyces nondiastaticus]|uniref:Fic family protein n=1 Tax=Streptomyces nondiastaticus TaxID=3154512 RepID=A0ABW6U5Z4_9ACTN
MLGKQANEPPHERLGVEIFNLNDIALDSSASQLEEEVQGEVESLRSLGEFSPEVQSELARSFLPDRISDTLNIEGVRVNARLTRAVLDGLAVSESDRYSEQEILNVNDSNALIESEAKSNSPLSIDLIKEVHRRIEKNLIQTAGSFRQSDVAITGAKYRPPSWADVPDLIREMCSQYSLGQNTELVRAAWLHATIAKIHPFMDGNGRTARMLQDFSLLRSGLLPIGIPISRRGEYYDALEVADEGSFGPLVSIMASAELAALDKARRIAQAPQERREKIRRLVKAAGKTTRQTEYNLYEVWRRRLEGFITELIKWLDELNEESTDFQFRYRAYEAKSFEKWKEIRDRGWAHGTWNLTIDVVVRGKAICKFLFYSKRHQLNWTTDPDNNLRDEVGLFISSVSDSDERFSFGQFSDPYISLREVLPCRDGILVYRDPDVTLENEETPGVTVESENSLWEGEAALSPGDVIEEFIQQVLVKLGLIDV